MTAERNHSHDGDEPWRGPSLVTPLLVTAVGTGWLLTSRNVIPGVQWAWILAMATTGVIILAIDGINRLSMVIGPSLLAAAFLSFLRQSGRIELDTEIPVLTVVIGLLWSVACVLPLRRSAWSAEAKSSPARAVRSSGG